ncbi:MAG: hypothetical protein ABSH41_28850 [Syntrophobacteraceae bacterium]
MATKSTTSGDKSSAMEPTASQTSRRDTYIVLNLLSPSRLEWLRQQRLLVAKAYQQSASARGHRLHLDP